MDFQLMRQLGAARYGGAAVGECLALAAGIGNADPDAWVRAFGLAGARQEADADARAARGHGISARDQYLVACNSYRAAEYYLRVDDPLHRKHGLASRRAFLAALRCGGTACEPWWFEQEGLRLPAYHIRGERSAGDRLLAIVSGFDGTLEETYIAYGAAALERGYDLLLFTGPGQMDTWRFNAASHFAPDFERIGRAVVDRALALPGLRPGGLALMGISFGGHFAVRIAAHEPRIGALIANSPIVDLHAYMTSFIGLDPAEMPEADDFGLDDLARIPDAVMNAQTREMARNLMLRFGRPGFREVYRYLREFRVDEAALARIACPCLALVGEGEGAEPLRQSRLFAHAVSGPAAEHVFTAEQGADGHCQTGNLGLSAAVAMDWLDEAPSHATTI
jgi:pimeloyl-ACP methyl ester carboxylesterase